MVTEQSQVLGFSPPIYYTAVGTSLPAYAAKFGAKKNGVLLFTAVDSTAPGQKEYRERHKAMYNLEPEIASIAVYATLQILQKAIEQVGEIDRKKIRDAIAGGTFETIADVYAFKNQIHQNAGAVSQWQGDEVVAIYPEGMNCTDRLRPIRVLVVPPTPTNSPGGRVTPPNTVGPPLFTSGVTCLAQ